MKAFGKVCVVFGSSYLLDFDELFRELQASYTIGYAGLFSNLQQSYLVLQTTPKKTYMALGKVTKIFEPFVQEFQVLPGVDNKVFGYTLIEERGRFRTRGGKRQLKTPSQLKITYLFTNPLGEEDVSHITPEQVDRLVGSEDEVVRYFDRLFDASTKREMMANEWGKFRRYSREKVRRWDKQEKSSLCRQLGIKPVSESNPDIQEDPGDGDKLEAPPVYDPDSDSEGNVQRKRNLLENIFVEIAPETRKDDFLKEFEILLLENPHNSNVIASTKDGYFKYFDGRRWVKAHKRDFSDKVTRTRVQKAGEILGKLKQISAFTRNQVSKMVALLVESTIGSEAIKDGVLAAENQEARLKLVQNKIERVGTLQNGVSHTTWKGLGV